MIQVIHLRGTSEPLNPGGISRTFLDALDPERFQITTPAYPADYGLAVSFEESNRIGREAVLERIRQTDGPVILSGYSAGAMIQGTLAADIAQSRIPGILPSRIEAVALLADPLRPEGMGLEGDPVVGGYGIAGQRWIPDIPTYWATASHDPISALSRDNPLRSAADLTAAFTLSPLGWDEWAADMYDRLVVRRDLQLWWKFRFRPGRLIGAIDALGGYLFRGEHTDAYLRQNICMHLARVVNEAVQG